jgi:polyhydroxyalkanoate synthase
MIRYLLDQGFEVFITSWKNPGEEMRDVRFDDYLVEGVQALVDTARGSRGRPRCMRWATASAARR